MARPRRGSVASQGFTADGDDARRHPGARMSGGASRAVVAAAERAWRPAGREQWWPALQCREAAARARERAMARRWRQRAPGGGGGGRAGRRRRRRWEAAGGGAHAAGNPKATTWR
ncbi:hypothetical protein [Oryza sativa Japonica Group]|uniref:Uncharacterized protein n=1 Tax=Oryza sativa subsp. japonica TaxID=39947 RepID=Q5ZA20_ORYSJ|nr:hypothetical protein [Oryza sativa Japonica Group]